MRQTANALDESAGGSTVAIEAQPRSRSKPSTRGVVRQAFRGRFKTALGLLLSGIGFLLIWEAVYRLGVVSPFILPSAFETVDETARVLWDILTGGPLLGSTLITMQEIVVGFALAAVVGVALGISLGETAFGRKIGMPYTVAFNAMPKVAFAPLLVAWLGFGTAPKILLAAIVSFFPIVVNTAVGVASASRNELTLFHAIEATRWQTLWKLKFPTALPFVFAGLEIASVLAVVGAVVGELMSGGVGGLGRRLDLASLNLRTAYVFAIIIVLSLLGLLVYVLVVVAERRIVYWRRPGSSTK